MQASLEKLAFQNVGCSVMACRAISELLTSAASLATFHFMNNMTGDEGATAIAEVGPHPSAKDRCGPLDF